MDNGGMHYRQRTSRLSLLIPLLFLVGCVKKPVYVPPSDPFDNSNSQYQAIRPAVEELIRRASDTETWYETSPEEDKQDTDALRTLEELTKSFHIPSANLFGRFFIAGHENYYATGGMRGKFKAHYAKEIKRLKITQQELELNLARNRQLGTVILHYCARHGYGPAIEKLKDLAEPIPEIDMKTAAQKLADEQYARDLANYEVEKKKSDEALGKALGAALALGAVAALASTTKGGYGGQSTTSSYSPTLLPNDNLDVQGCCSYHQGVSRDLLGNAECDFLGRVKCKDYQASPTCRCW